MATRDPGEWALDSLAIVRAQVYRLSVPGEITQIIQRAQLAIRIRFAQAGARLGWLLNQAFP